MTGYTGRSTGNKLILRLVYKIVEEAGAKSIVAGLLGEEITIKLYNVKIDSLIVQDPSLLDVNRVGTSETLRLAPKPWISYCRWHSGPLSRPDKPWERIYCNVPSDSYCRQHKRSVRHIYELCVTLRGDRGLAACRELDKIERIDYVVYLTDFGGDKPKAGMTRRFRFLERIAEQTHTTATILYETDSAFEARRVEMLLSKKGIAQEIKRQRPRRKRDLGESALRLRAWAERASKLLGVEWTGDIISVEPNHALLNESVFLQKLEGFNYPFRITGFWGGFLFVEAGGIKYALNTRNLQHKASLILLDQSV